MEHCLKNWKKIQMCLSRRQINLFTMQPIQKMLIWGGECGNMSATILSFLSVLWMMKVSYRIKHIVCYHLCQIRIHYGAPVVICTNCTDLCDLIFEIEIYRFALYNFVIVGNTFSVFAPNLTDHFVLMDTNKKYHKR